MDPQVYALGHIKLNTNRMDEMIRDATEILGLRVTHRGAGEVWLSANGRAAELVLIEAEENSTHTIGFEARSVEAVRAIADRAGAGGATVTSTAPSLACMAAGVTFTTPEGLRFEVHTPVGDDMYRPRYQTLGVGPRRLDHANLLTDQPEITRDRLADICGLRLSERMVNDALSWMYGGNRQHHIIGVVKGPGPGLHHYSFELEHFADYARLGDILDHHDRQYMWGPGRHRPGDNTYGYYVDSAGCIVECSGPMAHVVDDVGFQPRLITNLARPGNVREMNVWGAPAPVEWREHFFPFQSLT